MRKTMIGILMMSASAHATAQPSSLDMARQARQMAAPSAADEYRARKQELREALFDMSCPAHESWIEELSYIGNEEKIPWISRQHIVLTINDIDQTIHANRAEANMLDKKIQEKSQLIQQLNLKGTDLGGMVAVWNQQAPIKREMAELVDKKRANLDFAACLSQFRDRICRINAGIPEVASACSGTFTMPEEIFQ